MIEDKIDMQIAITDVLEADKRLDIIDGMTYSILLDLLMKLDDEIDEAEQGEEE